MTAGAGASVGVDGGARPGGAAGPAAHPVGVRIPGASGDPVREVMAEHRELCERAVDPLEIAAGLEEAGLGPADAARCRHADLFALAEELYARVPRRAPPSVEAVPGESRQRRWVVALRTAVLAALPCAAAAGLGGGRPLLLAAAVPLALVPAASGAPGADGSARAPGWSVAIPFAGRSGPAGAEDPAGPGHPGDRDDSRGAGGGERPVDGPEEKAGPVVPGAARVVHARLWWWQAVHGAGVAGLLLAPPALTAGGPGDRRVTTALVLAAALSAGSAEWSARWFRRVGRGHLGTAVTLAEFRARMRPVLPAALALHLAVLSVLTFAALAVLTAVAPRPGPGHGGLLHLVAERADPGQWAGQGVLGLLLVLPALLARCGRTGVAALGALAGAVVTAAPLPPVAGLAGGAVALALLVYAWPVLGRPDAHR
ncbi:hypothetical protein [Streptomyces sp. BE20]|uniref:hypothetical protein n=1 Tax=Streptomyces sp. BE20 TaxID=3002525 RepID=UPI002E77C775|nr:hypothetical protein [Streptomyces sp. BE20]